MRRSRLIFILVALALLLDRFLKVLALRQQLPSFDGWFQFTLVRNNALAFSTPVLDTAAMVLSVAALVALLVLIIRQRRTAVVDWAWLAIILGGASNVYDRIRYGAVIDYLQLGSRSVFNLADVLIGVGIFGLLVHELTHRRRRH